MVRVLDINSQVTASNSTLVTSWLLLLHTRKSTIGLSLANKIFSHVIIFTVCLDCANENMLEKPYLFCEDRRSAVFTAHALFYPASSWFLLRQTREKPLRATVSLSLEHARVCHAPRDAFDVNFIWQLIFCLKYLYKRMQISNQKRWQKKRDPNLRRSIAYI